ncbi:MAG: MFS transporter [Proteobacteria bacterium]|nr:MFS transporter [Pseudomonadota bacterium]MBU1452725.1 MFS transporter [Pseudomonadota bacterium]MBU2467865.1 MFS transporter [Pseudomonadota bacterium]MBU2519400.1 MFS transporter [Pseudomonadota bacterium]
MPSKLDPFRNNAKQGFYLGWVMVGLAFINLGVIFGIWYSFSVFFLALVQEFHWSRAVAASIFSIFIFCQSLTGPLAGRLMDSAGPRVTIPLGAVILAGGLVLVSQAGSLNEFRLAYGVAASFGVGLMGFSAHAAWLPRWFERQRGLSLGIAMSGIGVGVLLLVPAAEFLISHYGWRNAYLVLAAIVLVILLPLNLLFARRSPADLGLQPDGGRPSHKSGQSGPATIVVMDKTWAHKDWGLKEAAKTRRFWLLMAAVGFGSFCYQGAFMHAVAGMVDGGVDKSRAALFLGIMGIVGSMGKIGFGFISDRLGRELANTLAAGVASLGIFFMVILTPNSVVLPLLFAILFGFGYGAAAPLFPSVAADLFFGRSFGVIVAVIFLGASIGGSLGPLIMGLLRDISGDYDLSFEFAMVMLWLSCLLIWLTAPRKVRRVGRTKPSKGSGEVPPI